MVDMFDKLIVHKIVIDTLEGREHIGEGSIICLGEHDDIWQQTTKKFLQKYNVIGIDGNGWMICQPKPENSVKVFEVTNTSEFYIANVLWGEKTDEGFIQKGKEGDFICQSEEDSADMWIVARKIFNNTYTIL